ncbi:M48 family metallopeptidase [Flavobacterium sp.]|uniref:M48 family metallopeptidase n=1 Tax=Flavobacterium sp. TaxID=239 RepID=UPI003C539D26
MKPFLVKILLFSFFVIHGQSYKPYDTISFSKRKEVLKEFESRYEKKIKEIKNEFSGKISKDIVAIHTEQFEDFSKTVNNKTLYFDDKLQEYAQKIQTEIVASNPSLATQNIKIYFSRSPEPNAYSIGDGTIIFNLELLKYIEDEAEIGFVFCHEIAHFLLNHRDKSIQKKVLLQNSKEYLSAEKDIKRSKYNRQVKSEKIAKELIYSRKSKSRSHEFEADSLGMLYFKNTHYNNNSSIKLLNHLSVSDIEKDSLPKGSYAKNFTTKNQKFIKEWTVMEDFSKYSYTKANSFKWNIDSLKTHPNCDQRIEKIKKEVKVSAKDFYVDKMFFTTLKKNVFYEQVFNNYYLKNYGLGLYDALKLKEKDPKNIFLKEMIASDFEELAKAKKELKFNTYIPLVNPKEHTQSQQYFLGFMTNLTQTELQQLAADYKN